jgi:hypothetical protein
VEVFMHRIVAQRGTLLASLLILGGTACSSPTASDLDVEPGLARVEVTASVPDGSLARSTLEVTAPDLAGNLTFVTPVRQGRIRTVVDVPAGPGRTFRLRAYDSSGAARYGGEATDDLATSHNPVVWIELEPMGDVTIEITVAEPQIEILPPAPVVGVGRALALTALVTDGNGKHITADIRWASTSPAIATVDSSGIVSGRRPGTATIVATAHGRSGSVELTVR